MCLKVNNKLGALSATVKLGIGPVVQRSRRLRISRPGPRRPTAFVPLLINQTMSTIKKVIEVLASSDKSFEDALQRALAEASTTVKGIKSIYIKDQSCKVQDNKIVEYRITAKISFEVMHRWEPGHSAAPADASATEGHHPGGSATSAENGGGYSG